MHRLSTWDYKTGAAHIGEHRRNARTTAHLTHYSIVQSLYGGKRDAGAVKEHIVRHISVIILRVTKVRRGYA